MDMDVKNLLNWKGSGRKWKEPKQSLNEIPYLNVISKLRGLKKIKIAWKIQSGAFGMEDWAKTLAGYWRLPHGSDGMNVVPVDAAVVDSEDSKWRSIQWNAAGDSSRED